MWCIWTQCGRRSDAPADPVVVRVDAAVTATRHGTTGSGGRSEGSDLAGRAGKSRAARGREPRGRAGEGGTREARSRRARRSRASAPHRGAGTKRESPGGIRPGRGGCPGPWRRAGLACAPSREAEHAPEALASGKKCSSAKTLASAIAGDYRSHVCIIPCRHMTRRHHDDRSIRTEAPQTAPSRRSDRTAPAARSVCKLLDQHRSRRLRPSADIENPIGEARGARSGADRAIERSRQMRPA